MTEPVSASEPAVQLTPMTTEVPLGDSSGVKVVISGQPDAVPPDVIGSAIKALGEKILILQHEQGIDVNEVSSAFRTGIGPSVIYIYPGQDKIDGINYALNCGWEGSYAKGCQLTTIFPEQVFPENAWLILIAGNSLTSDTPITGIGLVVHEFAHNLTWHEGHLPDNHDGFNFVRYVGLDFAVDNMDALGVQAGRDTYIDKVARESNLYWQSELTADAVASWALDRIQGPYKESVTREIKGMLVCDYYGGTDC